jgi:threonine dehydrogenase-like Zn-dependent dehydrogenase
VTEPTEQIPARQYAVQLVGPDELTLNTDKPVHRPGPHQMLLKVEATGLCFSDLKLLKQFSGHVRKGPIERGIDASVLEALPSYVPGEKPTVPGHEAVCRVVEVGEGVEKHRLGERVLVQADWRELRTTESNGAFGYNFEGALQEYILVDERVVIEPSTGQRYLMEVDEGGGASAIALVEPWACVEDSYVTPERNRPRPGGRLLVVADEAEQHERGEGVRRLFAAGEDEPDETVVSPYEAGGEPEEAFDDVIYFGDDPEVIETLDTKLAAGGVLCVCLCGQSIAREVSLGVGRTHYGMTRWIGTTGDDPAEAYGRVPATGALRDGDRVLIVGAGGPMGQMHVIRDVCSGRANLEIVCTDFDDERLAALEAKVRPFAEANGVTMHYVNPQNQPVEGPFNYVGVMAPVPQLVAGAIRDAAPDCRINLFAGIPASVRHPVDLQTYIERGVYLFGTSGSTIQDMQIVLEKVLSGQLDTNTSVDAVCGMAGAVEGIRAVENRSLAGKILVYPALKKLGLTPLSALGEVLPSVAGKLIDGRWSDAAEAELLKVAE